MNQVLKLNSRNKRAGKKPPTIQPGLKLDLGCGPNKKPGFVGIDNIKFPGVDAQTDLTYPTWHFEEGSIPNLVKACRGPWPTVDFETPLEYILLDNSVEEAHSSHFMEHLTAPQRCLFLNELYRVLKPGGKATLITPHWASCRAYGDPTHQWPPVSEFLWYYLKRDWRVVNAPHTDSGHIKGGFNCNFEVTWGFSLEPGVATRNQEYQQNAIQYWKEACQDMIATLVKC